MPTQRDIEVEFWTSPAVVPAPVPTKLFFQYLLNGPQTNYIGIYRFSWDTCRRDTGLSDSEIESAILFGSFPQEHDGDPFLMFDREAGLIWVVKRLEHTFKKSKPTPLQAKGIGRMLNLLPRCPILKLACERYRELGEPFSTLSERIVRPHTNGDTNGDGNGDTQGHVTPHTDGTGSGGSGSGPRSSVSGPRSLVSGLQKTRARPDPAGGASGDASGNGSGKSLRSVLDAVQTRRFVLIAKDMEQQIKETRDRFNPYECLQRMVNQRLPVDIGTQILFRCRDAHLKEPIKNRWAWTQKVLDKEHMALHIRLLEAEHQATKNQKPNLEALGSVFRRIGSQHPGEPTPEEPNEAFS